MVLLELGTSLDVGAWNLELNNMMLFDLTLPSPAENLAWEEALLDAAEAGVSGEVLRFWEAPTHFVVVGYANKIATEANVAACEAKGIPILRRCSGGGTVVQGPGCLNYAVVLRISETGPTRSISTANQYVMERIRAGIQSAIGNRQSAISIQGHTDLAIVTPDASRPTPLKFSGNAQRRRKHFLLFHGSLLLNFDLPLISELLQMPSLQPDYRGGRSHEQFITNLGLPAAAVKNALATEWRTDKEIFQAPNLPAALVAKYNSTEWNEKL
jgi:lipoate-protein ligase A